MKTFSLIQFQFETENISEKIPPENSLKSNWKESYALVICDINGEISYINEAF